MLFSFLSKKLFSSSLINLFSNFKLFRSPSTSQSSLEAAKNELIKAFLSEENLSLKMKALYDKQNGEIMKEILLDRLQVLQQNAEKKLKEIAETEQNQKESIKNMQIDKTKEIASSAVALSENQDIINEDKENLNYQRENLIFGTSSLFLDMLSLLLLSTKNLTEKEFLVINQINSFINKYKEMPNLDANINFRLKSSFIWFIKTSRIAFNKKTNSFLLDRDISIIDEIFRKISKQLTAKELIIIIDALSKDQNNILQEQGDKKAEIFNLWLKDYTDSFFKEASDSVLPFKKYENLKEIVSFSTIKNDSISLLYAKFFQKISISNLSLLFQIVERLVKNQNHVNLEILSDHLEKCFATIESNQQKFKKEQIYKFFDILCRFCFLVTENITSNAVFEITTKTFFENIYYIMERILGLISLRITDEEECKIIMSTFNLFRQNRILNLNLLEKIENLISISNIKINVEDFICMLLFYVDSPIVVNGLRNKIQIDFFIQKNLRLLNAETVISIATALLQITFKPQSAKFDIYSIISPSTWSMLMDLIKNLDFKKLTKNESTKLFLFMKLMEFNSILKKDFFAQIGSELVSNYKKLDTRMISLVQKKLEVILKQIYGEKEVICEPELIEDIFSVDFAIKNKRLIFEMDGPQHFFAIVGDYNENNLTKTDWDRGNLEIKSELVEIKTNLIKRGLLERNGWFVVNITWRDMEMEEEKIKKYIENYVFIRDQEKARKMIGI